jgi:hypothetical protein
MVISIAGNSIHAAGAANFNWSAEDVVAWWLRGREVLPIICSWGRYEDEYMLPRTKKSSEPDEMIVLRRSSEEEGSWSSTSSSEQSRTKAASKSTNPSMITEVACSYSPFRKKHTPLLFS